MRHLSLIAILVAFATPPTVAATAVSQFLEYIYGAENVDIEKVCWPHDDLWMLRGPANAQGLREIRDAKIDHGKDEVVWERLSDSLCMVEVRDHKVDPTFSLDQIYFLHRRVVAQFLYAALEQDKKELAALVTNVGNVKFGRVRPARPGDMDVYSDILAIMPIVRTSRPASDKLTKSVTYRVSLPPKGFNVKLVRAGSRWLVDTSEPTNIPLEVFFEESRERKVIYAP